MLLLTTCNNIYVDYCNQQVVIKDYSINSTLCTRDKMLVRFIVKFINITYVIYSWMRL